jgi:hypothetical protein
MARLDDRRAASHFQQGEPLDKTRPLTSRELTAWFEAEDRKRDEWKREAALPTRKPADEFGKAEKEIAGRETILQQEARERDADWQKRLAYLEKTYATGKTRHGFTHAAQQSTERVTAPEEIQDPSVRQIWEAYQRSDGTKAFVAALEDNGMMLARVTEDEARASEIDSRDAKMVGKFLPTYKEGEIVVVTDTARVYHLSSHTTGAELRDIQKLTAVLDPKMLESIGSATTIMQERADLHEIERQAFRDLSSVGVLKRGKDQKPGREIIKDVSMQPLKSQASKIAGQALEGAADLLGGLIGALGDAFGATELTPERILAMAEAREEADAQAEIDWTQFKIDKSHEHFDETRKGEAERAAKLEREAAEKRQRDDRER